MELYTDTVLRKINNQNIEVGLARSGAFFRPFVDQDQNDGYTPNNGIMALLIANDVGIATQTKLQYLYQQHQRATVIMKMI